MISDNNTLMRKNVLSNWITFGLLLLFGAILWYFSRQSDFSISSSIDKQVLHAGDSFIIYSNITFSQTVEQISIKYTIPESWPQRSMYSGGNCSRMPPPIPPDWNLTKPFAEACQITIPYNTTVENYQIGIEVSGANLRTGSNYVQVRVT